MSDLFTVPTFNHLFELVGAGTFSSFDWPIGVQLVILFYIKFILANLSHRLTTGSPCEPISKRILYPWSGVRRRPSVRPSTTSKCFSSKTVRAPPPPPRIIYIFALCQKLRFFVHILFVHIHPDPRPPPPRFFFIFELHKNFN